MTKATPCEICGRSTRKRPRAAKARYAHKCPHGRWCVRGDRNAGVHQNHARCPDCLAVGRFAERHATPSAPDSASTAELGAPDGATAPGAGPEDAEGERQQLIREHADAEAISRRYEAGLREIQSALRDIADDIADALAAPPAAGSRPFDKIGADRLADEVAVLVRRGVIDSRSPAADALLDYRDPPSTPRADRLAALEAAAGSREARLEAALEEIAVHQGDPTLEAEQMRSAARAALAPAPEPRPQDGPTPA